MKKLLLVLAIGVFVACNDNSTDSDTTTADTATSTIDTNTLAAPDTIGVVSDSSALKTDSTKK